MKMEKKHIETDEPVYSISKAAQLVGLSVQMLRLYENEGLIIPYRKSSLHRKYSEYDIERLRCIVEMIRNEKISIIGIKRILSLIPCWAIKKCAIEVRQSCIAYRDHTKPCWLQKADCTDSNSFKCRECSVYKNINSCIKFKQILNQVENLVL